MINRDKLYLWRVDNNTKKERNGWYITTDLFDGQIDDSHESIHAWLKTRKGEPHTFPQEVHVPFHAKKKECAITIHSYSSYLEVTMEQLMNDEADVTKDRDLHNTYKSSAMT